MSSCDLHNPDNIFVRFNVIEFPVCFVGLSFDKYIDVETNLEKDAYLKTMCNGTLVKFEEARNISPSHRAFHLVQVNDHVIKITFNPINECICNNKNKNTRDQKFIFDLRLIQINGTRCCNNEFHSEIGRYYISGQYEYCNLSHLPQVLNFGEVFMNTEITKHVRIKNESQHNASLFESVKATGFIVLPCKFIIPPNSSIRLEVTFKPTSLAMKGTLVFEVRNPRSLQDHMNEFYDQNNKDTNFLSYTINCQQNMKYKKVSKTLVIESMHKLNEPDIRYTYIDEKELNQQKERKKEAYKHLQMCKSNYKKMPVLQKFSSGKEKCYSDITLQNSRPKNICKPIIPRITTYAVFDVIFLPYSIDFGNIARNTCGNKELIILNNTSFDITIQLQGDKCICYTNEKLTTLSIKLQAFSKTQITIICLGYIEGRQEGTFDYQIDNKYSRQHKYSLYVGNPRLRISDKFLKFGMSTSDSFVTSVPVRIYNDYNISVKYRWDELNSEIPFDIRPITGEIPKLSCKICDVIYSCRPTKSKMNEVDFVSLGYETRIVPVELNIMTRKVTVKFFQQAVTFKDVALNIETKEIVRLENSSREIATFCVIEPLIPGFTIVPMNGNLRPKMIMTFEMIVKISCVLEFSFDVAVRINNKEIILIPVSGNVVEPKITINPKNIFMPRIPCGMVTYMPLTFHNLGTVKVNVDVLDTGDDDIFDVYTIAQGNERQRIFNFCLDIGQSKIVFIKIMDTYRREYEMYIPFKINGFLGPPDQHSSSIELHSYISEYEKLYENNPKVKLKNINRDIPYCRLSGVITVPWIKFSKEKFEIDYVPNGENSIEFTMSNVSKYYLYVTIVTSKLSPTFSLDMHSEEIESTTSENHIKFEMDREREVQLTLKFHPKMNGRFINTAVLFLDKNMTIPYYNLTFFGKRLNPTMTPSIHRILFPPCLVGTPLVHFFTIKMGIAAHLDDFSCFSMDEPHLLVKFLDCETIKPDDGQLYSVLTVKISVSCEKVYANNLILTINHACGSGCDIEISFMFTYCILTLHTQVFVTLENNPYPFYPLSCQTELYDYMTTCTHFLEKWMFQQGFRRDLYPVIPDTFHALSTYISTPPSTGAKTKNINVNFLNFFKRISGPMMKYFQKPSVEEEDERIKCVKEIHDTYKHILSILHSRGSDMWMLKPKYLLSYDQFQVYNEYVLPKSDADSIFLRSLLQDIELFNRLSKQSWIDFILQCYKVFVMDSCFFDCMCVNNQNRDIIKVLTDWFNSQIILQQKTLIGDKKNVKQISNLTSDLSDGVAFASALLTHCPFLSEHFKLFLAIKEEGEEDWDAIIINNACLLIEAMNLLRLYFPLTTKDFLKPNFLQMLFLSIHLYVVLPMFKPREVIKFTPPLLRSSSRHVWVCPATQESLTFNHFLLNNTRNSFAVEKAPSADNGKKMYLIVKYVANFVDEDNCILLLHGYNKTRLFDSYMIFLLNGCVGALNPIKKCRVTGPLYRPNKVDVIVSTPFTTTATFNVFITDKEPTIPVVIESSLKHKFYVQRLNLMDDEITLTPRKETTQDNVGLHKIYCQLICLSTQISNSWIWFRSDIGEFFIRVTTQPRWDLAMDTLQAKIEHWPVDPCSCGESCECYRTAVLTIPHRNELMIKALRYALIEHASDIMMRVFDDLIETQTGKLILSMLLEDGGTNMSEVKHILRSEVGYRITSRTLMPREDRVVLKHHSSSMFPLPVTLPAREKTEKYSVTLTSDCGMDIRTYRIMFVQAIYSEKSDSTS